MAVNVSTISSVCLYCKANSETNTEKVFHEIYDEVGQELQLHALVETYFHIKVKNDSKKHLCEDCVNHLIELYDLEEHVKEKCSDLANFENLNIELDTIKKDDEEDLNFNIENLHDLNESGKIDDLKNELIENVKETADKSESNTFNEGCIQNDNDISENFLEQDFIIRNENELSVSCSSSRSSSPIEDMSSAESVCSDHIEFVENGGIQNMVIEIMVNNELETKIRTSATDDHISQPDNGTIDTALKSSNANNLMVYDVCEENETVTGLLVNDESNSQTEAFRELEMEDMIIEEVEDIYYDENSTNNEEEQLTNERAIYVENENIDSNSAKLMQNAQEKLIVPSSSNATRNVFIAAEDIEEQNYVEQDEYSNDCFSPEEEYLIEEISCSTEFDSIDLNKYLEKILVTKFQDLQLSWKTECKLCFENYNTFEELLNHSCIKEFEEEEIFYCLIKECDESMKNLPTLARHLILKHHDKLESVAIYGKCPHCQKTFSNIIDFNKHSCCRNIKRKAGSPNYCQYCDMDFQSLKRYVFHMQFHLTNHRPKVCLLCGDLFKNSNEFFEHTQYQHIPKTAMACIKCDRFFREKEVFNSHMELHEDSKYQYSCTLCPKKYTSRFGLNQHVDIYHNNKSNAFVCTHCEKEFVSKSSYRNHLKSHADDVQVESFMCSKCGVITNNSEFIKHHTESDPDSPCFTATIEERTLSLGYTCENCSLDFQTIKHLKQHRSSPSHSNDIFLCAVCGQSFKNLRQMRNHSINHKDFKERQKTFPITRFFVCNIGDCKEFYPIWTSLYYHKKRPHKTEEDPPNDFKCQFCHQSCFSKMSLAVHVARSHNNSNVKCSYCKRSFKSQTILQEHIDRYHTPVECDVCFKKFKHLRNLESHIKLVHLNLKRYFCKHCEKGYFHKSERDIHEKKVHPDISYKCEICNFTTTYPNSLEIHMDKHNNKLKFKCTICSKAFGRKQLLQCHLKRHLNKKDYSCANYLKKNGCTATFLTYNLLKTHIKTKHQNSSYSINIKEEEQRRKSSYKNCDAVESVSYEILNYEDDSGSEKETTSSLNDADLERETFELGLKNDA